MGETAELLLPNLTYLILVAGIWLVSLAIITPGTGVHELAAVLALGLAAVGMLFVPLNPWSLIPLGLGALCFVLAVASRRGTAWLLALAALLVSAGSIWLFGAGWEAGVHPLLASLVSLITVGFYGFAVRQVLAAQRMRPKVDVAGVLGQVGEARSEINPLGTAFVHGELWSARAEHPIARGSRVRVIGLDGLTLLVAPANDTLDSASCRD